jgi:hypothetical protein
MPRSWWVVRQLVTVTALGALAAAAVLAVTPAGKWVLRSGPAAAAATAVVSEYTCDLSNYGYTGPPVSVVATAMLGSAATAETGFSPLFGESGPVSFDTSVTTLPASVASQLANLDRLTLQATIPVSGAPAASPVAKIWGVTTSALLPVGPLTQLQVTNAVSTTFFSRPGTAWLRAPAGSLLFTPYRDYKPLPTISCAVVPGPVTPIKYTVTDQASPSPSSPSPSSPGLASPGSASPGPSSPSPTPASLTPAIPAPYYECASTYRTAHYGSPLPMSISTSGVLRVGRVLTVTLSSPVAGLAAPAPDVATELTFTGTLPVTGAQAGRVKLNEATYDAANPTFTVSGRLRLTKQGTDTITYPREFVYTIYQQTYKEAVFTCTRTANPKSDPDGLIVQVAR